MSACRRFYAEIRFMLSCAKTLKTTPWQPLLTTGFSQTVQERLGASWLGADTAGGPEDKDTLTSTPTSPPRRLLSGSESQRHLQQHPCLTEGFHKCTLAQRKGTRRGESEAEPWSTLMNAFQIANLSRVGIWAFESSAVSAPLCEVQL